MQLYLLILLCILTTSTDSYAQISGTYTGSTKGMKPAPYSCYARIPLCTKTYRLNMDGTYTYQVLMHGVDPTESYDTKYYKVIDSDTFQSFVDTGVYTVHNDTIHFVSTIPNKDVVDIVKSNTISKDSLYIYIPPAPNNWYISRLLINDSIRYDDYGGSSSLKNHYKRTNLTVYPKGFIKKIEVGYLITANEAIWNSKMINIGNEDSVTIKYDELHDPYLYDVNPRFDTKWLHHNDTLTYFKYSELEPILLKSK